MNKNEIGIIQELLMHDLNMFAYSLGALKEKPELNTQLAVKALNTAERFSRDYLNESSKQKCLLICALIWEHRSEEWHALSAFLTRLLSRIGLSPTLNMINSHDSFSSLGSIIDELYTASYIFENEVLIGEGKKIILSNFQKKIWDELDTYKCLGISAPTSAGKSYVLINKIIQRMINGEKSFLFIVPTISLINQLAGDFRKALNEYGITDCIVHQVVPHEELNREYKHIFILTQERLTAGLNVNTQNLYGINLAVFDEIQNIEKASYEDDERAKRLYESILMLSKDCNPRQIVISGPRISNISRVTKDLFGDNSISLSTELPPVLNITYSFSNMDKKLKLKQYNYIVDLILELELPKGFIKNNLFGQQMYNKDIMNFVSELTNKLNLKDSGTIIFSPTPRQTPKIAKLLSEEIVGNIRSAEIDLLVEYISDTIHPNYQLLECIKKGIGYHHGKMPMHLRNVIEIAFKKFIIQNIVCTTTLVQGVNLPAKNIITRNPNLYTRRSSNQHNPTLTGYEFANLRGRAGRLMQDFLGRTIILDEEMFLAATIDPSSSPSKEIETGYELRFNNNEEYLIEALVENEEVTSDTQDRDLLIYIRQMIIKYGNEAKDIFRKVGINISKTNFDEIKKFMDNLYVDRNICINNRYWDPLVLDKLFKLYKDGYYPRIPTNPYDKDYIAKLTECLKFLKKVCPLQFYKYLNLSEYYFEQLSYRLLIKAQSWSLGHPLSNIINWKDDISNDDIEDTLQDVNKYVQYNLPTLLKPLVEIENKENNLLVYMETGVFSPFERKLIELGFNRELAIRIGHRINPNHYLVTHPELINSSNFKLLISEIETQLHFWDLKQIEVII